MKMLHAGLFAALLLTAGLSFAQTKEGDLVADVPFAFVVAGQTLPPGHYVVNHLSDSLGLHDRKNRGVFVPTHSAERSRNDNSSKMVFHRYGDTYFLAEVWTGQSIGRALFPSRAEREAAEGAAEREIAVVRMGK